MKISSNLGLTLAVLALPALGCGPEYAVIPQGGVNHQTVSAQGVLITAFADQWRGDPEDLANVVTPIAVDLYNGTQHEVRVSLLDFELVNPQGVRIPAFNPFETPIAANGVPDTSNLASGPAREGTDGELQLRVSKETLLAGPLVGPAGPIFMSTGHGGGGGGGHGGGGGGHGGGGGGGHFGGGVGRSGGGGVHYAGGGHYGGMHYSSGVRGTYAVGGQGARWGHPGFTHGPHWGHGFHPYGGAGWWYGPANYYWGGPWAFAPGYDMWVVSWDTMGYAPTPDVVEYALPEGVLQPGAHVNGFIYFKKATGEGVPSLTLTWRPHDAQADTEIGEAHVVLDVVKL